MIYDKGTPHVIIKGGKALDQDKSYDLYYDGQQFYQLTTDMFNKVIIMVQDAHLSRHNSLSCER